MGTDGLEPASPRAAAGAVERLIALRGSTTAFLEDLLGAEILVRVVRQWEHPVRGSPKLERYSVLEGAATGPLVSSWCLLNLTVLDADEAVQIRSGDAPLGRILRRRRPETLSKTSVEVESVGSHELADLLATGGGPVYLKRFKMWHAGRAIGLITEAFSTASLTRAVDAKRSRASEFGPCAGRP